MEKRPILDNSVHAVNHVVYEDVFALFRAVGVAQGFVHPDQQVSAV